MRRRERRLSADELSLWRHAMRQTAPLRPERALPEPAAVPPQPPATPAPEPPAGFLQTPTSPPRPIAPQPVGGRRGQPAGMDRNLWRRLVRGAIPIDGRLDLHGLTQDEAHRRLVLFLGHSQLQGSRCVLVITGRGPGDQGILKRAVPHWLETPPNAGRVLAFHPARPQHGGDGALYVLLRRRR